MSSFLRMLPLASLSSCAKVCDMNYAVETLAGADAVDCGWVSFGDNIDAWVCAVEAFKAGAAFHVVDESSNVDSIWREAIVSNGDRAWRLEQDDLANERRDSIFGWHCLDPYVSESKDGQTIECGALGGEETEYALCGP